MKRKEAAVRVRVCVRMWGREGRRESAVIVRGPLDRGSEWLECEMQKVAVFGFLVLYVLPQNKCWK